jgi:hypothetical protein
MTVHPNAAFEKMKELPKLPAHNRQYGRLNLAI